MHISQIQERFRMTAASIASGKKRQERISKPGVLLGQIEQLFLPEELSPKSTIRCLQDQKQTARQQYRAAPRPRNENKPEAARVGVKKDAPGFRQLRTAQQ